MDKTHEEISRDIAEAIPIKYEGLDKFCDGEDHHNTIIQELYLFEIVLRQLNTIFKDTLYVKEIDTLRGASDETTDALADSFAIEFMKKTEEEQALSSLPDLGTMIKWIKEIHLNLAAQIFNEDIVVEMLAPAYENMSEAIIDVSKEQDASETTEDSEEDSSADVKRLNTKEHDENHHEES